VIVDEQGLVREYLGGLTAQKISEQFGISVRTTKRILRRWNARRI